MLLSRSYLEQEATRRNISEFTNIKQQIIHENYELAHSYDSSMQKKYDIFLSHSSLDKRLVLTLVKLFNEAKYSVYVDWIEDTQLDRSNVNKDTAGILRERMDSSKGLSYIATSNATNSKWCPWELGYFDGRKNSRCCILPVVEGSSFRGQEYLGLYPYIKYEKNISTGKYDFWVYNQGTSEYIILKRWLEGSNPYLHI